MSNDMFRKMQEVAANGDREEKQLSFQERIVKQLLRRANITLQVRIAKAQAAEQRGSEDLGFKWFNDQYPRFPLRLMSQKLKYTHLVTIGQLYGQGQFKKLPWWQEYVDQAGLYGVDLTRERAALVFNLPYAKDAFLMVLHNQPIQDAVIIDAERRRDEPWPRTTFPMGNTGVVAVLEAFDSFLQTVGTEWAD